MKFGIWCKTYGGGGRWCRRMGKRVEAEQPQQLFEKKSYFEEINPKSQYEIKQIED